MHAVKNFSLPLSLLVILLGTPVCQLRAETIILATGEKLEGKILGETDNDVTLEVKISSSITDTKVINKKDVVKIEKDSPEETAFKQIKSLRIDPQNSLKTEDYDPAISRLQSFLQSFPSSARAADLKATLAAFQAEKKRVEAGDIKISGTWISSVEAARRRIQIQAQEIFNGMKGQTARQDLTGALNSFDLIEKKYAVTRVYPDAVDLARQILPALQADVANRLKLVAYNQEQFKTVLDRAKPEDVPKIRAAEQTEQNQYAATIASAKKSGAKWIPLIPRSQASLNELQGLIPPELARIASIPVQKMHASVSLTDDARQATAAKDPTTAANLLADALRAWPQNEDAAYLKQSVAPAKPEPTATPKSVATEKKAVAEITTASDRTAAATVVEENKPLNKPFYMTIKGTLWIIAGILVVFGGISLLGRLQKPKAKSE